MSQVANQTVRSLAANSGFVTHVRWVRKPDLAKHLSLSLRSIDNLIAQKKIPFARFGRSIRFRITDVDRALERFVRREAR